MQTNDSPAAQQASQGSAAAQANVSGVPPSFLWTNTLISCMALALAIFGLIFYGILYRELERESRIQGERVNDMRASLIARDINPNNHDTTDAGGNKP